MKGRLSLKERAENHKDNSCRHLRAAAVCSHDPERGSRSRHRHARRQWTSLDIRRQHRLFLWRSSLGDESPGGTILYNSSFYLCDSLHLEPRYLASMPRHKADMILGSRQAQTAPVCPCLTDVQVLENRQYAVPWSLSSPSKRTKKFHHCGQASSITHHPTSNLPSPKKSQKEQLLVRALV